MPPIATLPPSLVPYHEFLEPLEEADLRKILEDYDQCVGDHLTYCSEQSSMRPGFDQRFQPREIPHPGPTQFTRYRNKGSTLISFLDACAEQAVNNLITRDAAMTAPRWSEARPSYWRNLKQWSYSQGGSTEAPDRRVRNTLIGDKFCMKPANPQQTRKAQDMPALIKGHLPYKYYKDDIYDQAAPQDDQSVPVPVTHTSSPTSQPFNDLESRVHAKLKSVLELIDRGKKENVHRIKIQSAILWANKGQDFLADGKVQEAKKAIDQAYRKVMEALQDNHDRRISETNTRINVAYGVGIPSLAIGVVAGVVALWPVAAVAGPVTAGSGGTAAATGGTIAAGGAVATEGAAIIPITAAAAETTVTSAATGTAASGGIKALAAGFLAAIGLKD